MTRLIERIRRPRLPWRHQVRPGASPGEIVPDPRAARPVIQMTAYGPDVLEEVTTGDPEEITALRERFPSLWVHVVGLGDPEVIQRIGDLFGLHPLALEDVVNQHQRPKAEDYGSHIYVTLQALGPEDGFPTEQVNIFFGQGFVVTLQERAAGRWDPVRQRLRRGGPRMRQGGSEYLAYALMDAVVDTYYGPTERRLDELDRLEVEMMDHPRPETIHTLSAIKRDLLTLRRGVHPLREVFTALIRDENELVGPATRPYLRDVQDHAIRLADLADTARDLATNLMSVHLSLLGQRTNEIMRVLTIIATIFIPLTFIAGIYGMNFDPQRSPLNMPELRWYWGYPAALTLMAAVSLVLLVFFRRKGWLGGRS